jgi:uncharacterized protein YjbI with pentapeptide repeats
MANLEHVHVVKRGRDAIAYWRKQHPEDTLDLNASYLTYARIPQVDLHGSDLRDADLMGATLQRANLSESFLNRCHLSLANLTQANLRGACLADANLRGVNFTQADLSNADLGHAVLNEANLTGANLTGATLTGTNLTEANLTEARLNNASLTRATLTRTNLSNTNLEGCDLYEASFNSAILTGAKLTGAIIGYSMFQNCDLREVEGLENLQHDAPSTIGIDSLFRSGGHIPMAFLRDIGVPEAVCSFQESLVGAPPLLEDCFISCAVHDLNFARSLQADLRKRGIRCWLFPDNARGNLLNDHRSASSQRELTRLVRYYDKLVVLCSEAAFQSETVQNDINRARKHEENRGLRILYLVAVDNTLTQPRHRLARVLSNNHEIFDLRERESARDVYDKEVTNLSAKLKLSQPVVTGTNKDQNTNLGQKT